MKKYILFSIIICLSNLANAQCIGDPTGTVRSVYIVPQLSTSQLVTNWLPILDKIGKDTHQCLELKITRSIPEFEKAFLSGKPDYAFMNPYHEVMAFKAQKYIPLVADDKKRLDGIIVVRKDNPIQGINELNGKAMAFPAPNSFAASLLIRSTLANKNIKIDPHYVKTHSNVYRSVILGDVVAGGGVNYTLDREPQSVRDKLRILYTTSSYTPHPFSAHPRVPKEVREAVINSFIDLSVTEQGQSMLDLIQIPKPVRVYYTSDYAQLETLGLERFVQNDSD